MHESAESGQESSPDTEAELRSVSDDGTILPDSPATFRSTETPAPYLETNLDISGPPAAYSSPHLYPDASYDQYSSRLFTDIPREDSRQPTPRPLTPISTPFLAAQIDQSADGKMADNKRVLRVCSGILVVLVAIITSVILSSLHRVEEGNVGIYYKYGALLEDITHPGMHYMAPFVTDVRDIQIRPQTDTLPPLVSITKDGIQNTFNDVQVISRVKVDQLIAMVRKFGVSFRESLIYDRVKEELRIFCANHTIDQVYNTMFLDIAKKVRTNLDDSITRLGEGGIEILNLVISKPSIPSDIAHNYKQVM